MPIVLVIKEKGDVHSVLLTTTPIVLGRSSSSDVKISDEKVSGKHLALKLNSQGRVMMKDLETTNGTLLNGAHVKEGYLMISDKLTIGDIELRLDESQMGPKEKQALTRDAAPTQVKYIPMPGNTATGQKALKKKTNEKQIHTEKSRLVDSAKKASRNQEVNADLSLPEKKQFEMEQATGSTQMLKASVEKQAQRSKDSSSSKKGATKNPSKKPKVDKKPEKKSLLKGLFQMFKRD